MKDESCVHAVRKTLLKSGLFLSVKARA